MLTLEPPLVVAEPMPFGPRVSYEGLFEQLAEPIANALAGADGPLASVQVAIGGNTADGLDGSFTSTIGAAEQLAAHQGGIVDDQVADRLVDAGEGSENYRQSVLGYLPQPDAPIVGNFEDFPRPPNQGTPGEIKGPPDVVDVLDG